MSDFDLTSQAIDNRTFDSETNSKRHSLVSTNYLTLIDEVSSTVTYLGDAAIGSVTSGSVWRIQKITVSGAVTTIAWADGNDDFDNEWDDRASLTYS